MSPVPHATIREWLARSGYPFELRAGQRFASAGWAVNYSSWYTDTVTGKARELDVHAHMGFGQRLGGTVVFSLCVECKRSPERPWVGFSADSDFGTHGILTLYKGPLARLALSAGSSEQLPLPEFLPPSTPRVGGLVAASGSKDDGAPGAPYQALLQVCSAVRSLDDLYGQTTLDTFPDYATIAIRLPLVVIDAQLLTFTLLPDGTEELREVPALVASVPGDGPGEQAIVPVITADYLTTFAPAILDQARAFCEGLAPHLRAIIPTYSIEQSGLLEDDDDGS